MLYRLILLLILARQHTITIDATHVIGHVPDKLYGSCIEDVNHEIYGGLYDQRLFGESFEEPAVTVKARDVWFLY